MRETTISLLVIIICAIVLALVYQMGRKIGYLNRSIEEADVVNEIIDNARMKATEKDFIKGVFYVVDKFIEELWKENENDRYM